MAKIAVVTDSTADLPPHLYRELGITVVPLFVHFGDEVYRDGVDLSSEEFYAKLASTSVLPRTSQPSPRDFAVVYEQLVSRSDGVVSIHLSSKLSGTYQSAVIAAGELKGAPVRVIDGRLASAATGLLVLEAARMAAAGAGMGEIVARVEELIGITKVFFTVDTLEYLEKNGRIGKATAFLGTLLSIRPLLWMQDGEVAPYEKVRGSRQKILARLVDAVGKHAPADKRLRVAVVHAASPDEASVVKDAVEKELACEETIVTTIGSVIGSHAGPGTIAVAFHPAS
ncbi:MAG: DegV family protein [Firmicutes bacterium]|nr:DegV family protein [Bacillota bacterium]MDH7494890.1 DegV family protein [Bacillota bacterium]